ncbi:MAG TPA: SDR family oxidoreductase [Solirubrobacterales bacterium]|nr:SDR family oxidoreductase [Solirubrobacterales bacterium]
MAGELHGNALVTGGSRGIGRACALAAASRGADVAITYVANREAAEATAAEIRALGRRALAIQGDVGDPAANVGAVEAAVAELGPLRYLVASAANGSFGLTEELTVEDWDRTMETHVRALLSLAQAARPSMREAGGGAIVAISSLGAQRVYDAYGAFGTAKAAIETLVRYLAVEGGPDGIRANCVRGGVVLTDLFKEIPEWEAIAAAAAERAPLGAALRPEEIGAPVAFLLSDDARMVTGQTLCVDAGFTLPG